MEGCAEKNKSKPTQYIRFEGPENFESFRMMDQFAHDVTDVAIGNHLLESLSGKRPFGRFNQALKQYKDVLQQWYGFKNDQYVQLVQRQLDGYNIAEENI